MAYRPKMSKPKAVVEAKPKSGEKPDDLEIDSIGSLYNGPWDKKYWSSSRGKDRYPYPVGYRAVRADNGSTYKMEIQEGPKGPLFSIISADGQSSSGQTPDIAWKKFQKTFFPRTKIWHGKIFSRKIDGVEFFGFKNPFVQRLLRELAANVNGTAERSLVPSSFCNGASRADIENRSPDACSYLEIPRITGKRSRRREGVNSKSFSWASIKRTRSDDLACGVEASNSTKENKRSHNHGNSMPSSMEEKDGICKYPKVLQPLVHFVPANQEESGISPKDSLQLDSVGFSKHLRKDAIHKEPRVLVASGNCKSTAVASNLSVDEEKPLHRSKYAKVEGFDFPVSPEDKNVDTTAPKDCEGLTDLDLCAPDTLDFAQDTTADSASTIQNRSSLNVVISEEFLIESHPEEDTAPSKSNASSEMSDFDSVGQEMTKSMMKFLLPQAIPFLTKGLRKEKGIVSPLELLPSVVNSKKEINETNASSPGAMLAVDKDAKEKQKYTQNTQFVSNVPAKCVVPDSLEDDQYSGHIGVKVAVVKDAKEKQMCTQHTDFVSNVQAKSVVPDSLEDDQYVDHVVNHIISSSEKAEADQDSSDGACLLNSHGHLLNTHGNCVAVTEHNELLDGHLEINESKDMFSCKAAHMVSTGKLQECDQFVAESFPLCSSPHKIVFSEETRKSNATAVDLPEAINIIDHNQGGELNSLKPSESETAVKTTVAENRNESFTLVPNLAYTRRKVQNICPIKGNYSGPLSESIICRNKVDICVPESYPSTETLLASETLQMGSSDDKSNKRNPFCAEAKIEGYSSSLNAEKPFRNSINLFNRVASAVLQDQTLVGASKEIDTSYSLDLTVTHLENHVDKDLVGKKISSDHNSIQRDSFCDEARIAEHSTCVNAEKPSANSEGLLNCIVSTVLPDQALVGTCKEKDTSSGLENHFDKDVIGHKDLLVINDSKTSQKRKMWHANSVSHSPDLKPHNMELNNEPAGSLTFVGCYSHPNPVLSVLLCAKGSEIYFCVLCGLLADKDGSLFIYKVAIEEPEFGSPSFVGHTSVTLPIRKDYLGGIALESSSLQFTPDGQYLVLLDCIKTPYCRQGSINCLCSICTSSCSDESMVKIVQVKLGYVSMVARLKAIDRLECILICEPNNLVAVGESGRVHLWVMNSTWSEQIETFVMPAEDCISPGLVELKRIPNCSHIVVGHNGCGEFSLWDISKRILVARFSASCTSISQFLPISLFTWKIKSPVSGYSDIEEHVNQMMAATSDDQYSLKGEDIAVSLLVSSSSDSDFQQDFISGDYDPNPVGRWRLALLVKNMVIFGSALDPRAAVVGATAGQGIYGTCDGIVHMWEISTGTKFGSVDHFKGGSVSCIATDDDSRSGAVAVAVAGDDQLLVYMLSKKSPAM